MVYFAFNGLLCFSVPLWFKSSSEAMAESAGHVDDMALLAFVHVREERQADEARPLPAGDRQKVGSPAKLLAIIRMQVQRPPVNGAANALVGKRLDERVAIDRQP